MINNDKELCKWLRDNSSGIYRPAAQAADRIEQLKQQLFEMQGHAVDCCDQKMVMTLDFRISETLAE